MKLSVKEILPAAQLLEQAKCSTLNDSEFNTTLKMANVICPILAEAQKAEERVRESAKTPDWEEIVELIQKARKGGISPEESERVNEAMKAYNGKVSTALADIEAKEHDIVAEPLPEGVPAKLMRENNWAFGAIALLKPITAKAE